MAAVALNLKDKRNVIDWNQLPAGVCDLNYRPVSAAAQRQSLWLLGLLVLIATATLALRPVVALLGEPLCQLNSSLLIPIGVTGLVTLATLLGWYQPWPALRSNAQRISLARDALGAMLGGWLLLAVSVHAQDPTVALVILCCLALPLLWLFADQVAQHFVFWMTAHPRIPHRTMLVWRNRWQQRFDVVPVGLPCSLRVTSQVKRRHAQVIASLHRYQTCLIWGVLTLLPWPLLFVIAELGDVVDRPGIWCVGGLLIHLSIWAVCRARQYPRSLQLFFRAFSSFSCYGLARRDPPWVFQSPCGSQLRRLGIIVGILMLLMLVTTPALWAEVSLPRTIANAQSPWPILSVILFTIACPIALLLLVSYIVATPALAAFHTALEVTGAYEKRRDWSFRDGYLDRLQHSRNPEEQRSILLGFITGQDIPVLLDSRLLAEHQHILGATGIGKTALALIPQIEQAIRRNQGPVLIIDGKGDRALFHSVRLCCEQQGRRFKWWTNLPSHSTYLFNPWLQNSMQRMSLEEILGLITQALNLHHGSDYGRAWYSITVRILLKRALEISMFPTPSHSGGRKRSTVRFPPPRSFRELAEIVRFVARDSDEFEAAQHLAFSLEALAGYEQLNAVPNGDSADPVVKHAIHMPDVIAEKQVIYFYMNGTTDISSAGELGKLAIFSYLKAAEQHLLLYGERPYCPAFVDEAQLIVAKNLSELLAAARSAGMCLTLAHQSMSQLNPPGGPDLRDIVQSCTSVKLYLSARDKQTRDYLTQASGQVAYWNTTWQQSLSDLWQGHVGPSFARCDRDGNPYVNVNITAGPRIDSEDLNDINRQHLRGVFLAERNEGFTQFQGAVPLDLEWPMSKVEYDRRNDRLPWPAASAETMTVEIPGPRDFAGITPITTPSDSLVPQPNGPMFDLDPLQQLHALLWDEQQRGNPNNTNTQGTDP